MTPDESFQLYLSKQDLHGLPWQTPVDEVRGHFMAGWAARDEAVKQTALFSPEPVSVKAETAVTAEAIYAAYPRKVGKQAAIKAIEKAAKLLLADKARTEAFGPPEPYLLQRTKAYAEATTRWPAADKQFIPHPTTWFNRGSYDDPSSEWQRGAAATGNGFSKTYN